MQKIEGLIEVGRVGRTLYGKRAFPKEEYPNPEDLAFRFNSSANAKAFLGKPFYDFLMSCESWKEEASIFPMSCFKDGKKLPVSNLGKLEGEIIIIIPAEKSKAHHGIYSEIAHWYYTLKSDKIKSNTGW